MTVKLYGNTGNLEVHDSGDWQPIRSDASTEAIITISYPHHEDHAGSGFWMANNATLGNAEVNTVAITTPNSTKECHLLMQITSSAVATLDVLEDLTSIAGGAAFTPLNFNRNKQATKASVMVGKVGDTTGADAITPTDGTTIWLETLGAAKTATTRENGSELILLHDAIYLFRITNGAVSNNCTILLDWYEHTPRG